MEKQRTSLFAGAGPAELDLPVWVQHSRALLREYVRGPRPAGVSAAAMAALIVRYQAAYLFRHHAKQGYLLHRLDQRWEAAVQWSKDVRYQARWVWYRTRMTLRPKHLARVTQKYVLHVVHRAVYAAAVFRRRARAWSYEAGQATRRTWALARRAAKRLLYDLLVLTHRLGLRGRRGTP